MVNLGRLYQQTVRSLSLGQRMLCDIAAAFLHNPQTIFLDEPSIGLDVSIKRQIRRLIQQLNREFGSTVILTSHDMGDVDELCERIVLIDKGSMVFDGAKSNFVKRYGAYRTLVLNSLELSQAQQVQLLTQELAHWDTIEVLPHQDSATKVVFHPEQVPLVELMSSIQTRLPLSDFSVNDMEMEQVILKAYEDQV